jgi:hypothetical protein
MFIFIIPDLQIFTIYFPTYLYSLYFMVKLIPFWTILSPDFHGRPSMADHFSTYNLSDPLLSHLLKTIKRGCPLYPSLKIIHTLCNRYARRDIPGLPRIPPPGRRCRLPDVPRHTAGRRGIAPPAGTRKTDNPGCPARHPGYEKRVGHRGRRRETASSEGRD